MPKEVILSAPKQSGPKQSAPKSTKPRTQSAPQDSAPQDSATSRQVLAPEPIQGEQTVISRDVLRPQRMDDFVGQATVKGRLNIMIMAAKKRRQPLEHLLFAGPPGLGKTTLSHIITNEMDAISHQTSGPALERTGDLVAILNRLEEGDVLFIDEIHRLPRTVEEVLYPAMEDFRVDIILGKGPAARTLALEIAPFTLVAATTRTALITSPLRDRFGLAERLDYYSEDDLSQIVGRTARILGVGINPDASMEVAKRSRGTPRIANRLLRRVRDYCQSRAEEHITTEAAHNGLEKFGIDEKGLDEVDRLILKTLCENFAGEPVGLTTLAISVNEPPEAVEDVYEPFLIQQGFLKRTPKGRVATAKAWLHLKLDPPEVGNEVGNKAQQMSWDSEPAQTDPQ